jgi:quinol monooxygenase YgiN
VEATGKNHDQRVTCASVNSNSRAKGVKAIYTGMVPTHPGLFCVIIIWDNIHSHHKFQHSPEYKSFMVAAAPIIAGDLEIAHFEITDKKALKKALESPCTQISHLFIKKGFAADFLKAYHASFEKYIVGEKFTGMCLSYSYEDP